MVLPTPEPGKGKSPEVPRPSSLGRIFDNLNDCPDRQSEVGGCHPERACHNRTAPCQGVVHAVSSRSPRPFRGGGQLQEWRSGHAFPVAPRSQVLTPGDAGRCFED